jgi:hypothetical protein
VQLDEVLQLLDLAFAQIRAGDRMFQSLGERSNYLGVNRFNQTRQFLERILDLPRAVGLINGDQYSCLDGSFCLRINAIYGDVLDMY